MFRVPISKIWYGSKECQEDHYSLHKLHYKARKVAFSPLISPTIKKNPKQDISYKGFVCVSNAVYGPLLALRDPSSGVLFDSLRDLELVEDDHDDHCHGCPHCGH